ncbi:MAG: divalent-cation tolerance protein CutA [Candidatus Micrarchaeota archaeon]|nr:divalent-cation tolerance protein CutA [Candidatus Micrarchaeota archaeon]
MEKFVQVTTTFGSYAEARKFARILVEKRLAACVQITPIASTYRWKGKIREEKEHLVLIKTKVSALDGIGGEIAGISGYELPEMIVTPIIGGNDDYLGWVDDNVI